MPIKSEFLKQLDESPESQHSIANWSRSCEYVVSRSIEAVGEEIFAKEVSARFLEYFAPICLSFMNLWKEHKAAKRGIYH